MRKTKEIKLIDKIIDNFCNNKPIKKIRKPTEEELTDAKYSYYYALNVIGLS